MASLFPKGSFKDLVDCALDVLIPCTGESDIVYFPSKGGSLKIVAVFDDDWIDVDVNTEEFVSMQAPRIGIKLNALPYPPTDRDEVGIGERRFRVKECREDGQGGATVFLREVK